VVNENVPFPPCVFFTRMTVAPFALVNVQVTEPPGVTVKPAGDPLEQFEFVSCQPACAVSLMVNVFVGSMFVNDWTAVDATVVSVVFDNPPPPVVVNVNVPLLPVVFLTRTIVPCFVLVKVHVTVPPAATVNPAGAPVEQVEFVSCHPVGVASLMENVCVGSTLLNVCVAVEADVDSVVFESPPPPVVVNANEPFPPIVFLTRTTVAFLTLSNVHVTVAPAATVKPVFGPLEQFGATPCCQPDGIASVML
jgi:hypothetical protein